MLQVLEHAASSDAPASFSADDILGALENLEVKSRDSGPLLLWGSELAA